MKSTAGVALVSVVCILTACEELEELLDPPTPKTIERLPGVDWGDVLDGDTVGPMHVRVLDQDGQPLPNTKLIWQNHAIPEGQHTLLTTDHSEEGRELVVTTDDLGESEMLWVTKRYRPSEHTGFDPEGRLTTVKPLDAPVDSVVYEMFDFFLREMHGFEPVGPTTFQGQEGDTLTLKVRAADQFNQVMPDSKVQWSTQGEEYGELSGTGQGVEIIELTDGHGESTVLLILGPFVGEHVVVSEPIDGVIEEGLPPVLFEIQSGPQTDSAEASEIAAGSTDRR